MLLLLVMIIDIFSILFMFFEPKQVFSGTKHIIIPDYILLKPEIIKVLKYIKSWFAAGLFTKEDFNQVLVDKILKI